MSDLKKIVVTWTGLTGLPGVSVFYGKETAANPVSDLNTFFTSIQAKFPSGLSWQLPAAGDTIDSATGHPSGSWTSTGGGSVSGSGGAAPYAAGTGCKILWKTTGVTPKFRKINGLTYLTHISASQYDTDGTLISTAVSAFQSAATALVATTNFGIWHKNSPGGSDGTFNALFAATVLDRTSSLRSRRI